MLKEIIIFLLIAYLASRLLRFLMPIFRITSLANDHVKNMREQMQSQMNQMDNKANQANTTKRKVEKEGDYIDYEEIK